MPSISPYDSNYFESSIDASDLQAVISLRNIKSLTLERINKLNALGIFTVSDLIRYKPIHDAKFLLALDSGEIVHDYDYSHLADNTSKSLKELLGAECVELKSVSVDDNVILKSSLGISTIRSLANYSAYAEAIELIEKSNNVFSEEPSAPNELIPKLKGSVHSYARYVSYIRENTVTLPSSMLSYDAYTKKVADSLLQDLIIPGVLTDGSDQIIKIHLGYIAEFKQKWTFVNTQLGEIIHSLALAPGESRNITIIDWKRSQITSAKDDAGVSEQLSNNLVHRRALDEVTSATAKEHVNGRTDAEGGAIGGSLAITSGSSATGGAAGKGNVEGYDVAGAGGASASGGNGAVVSGGYAKGTVTSSNDGERNITGNLAQNIMDTVSQKASNLRSLWSVVVAEDNQTENKQINTRNVTNYNHSHALTIQYYEVLHRYRAETALSNVVPIIYFPYHPLKFSIELVVKYWSILKNYLDSSNDLIKKMEPVIAYYNSGKATYNPNNDYKLMQIQINVKLGDSNYGNSKIKIPGIIDNLTGSTSLGGFNYESDPTTTAFNNFKKLIISCDTDTTADIFIHLKFINSNNEEAPRDIKKIGFRFFPNTTKTVYGDGNYKAEYILPHNITSMLDDNRPSDSLVKEIENYFNSKRYFFTRILLQSIENQQLIDLIQGIVFTEINIYLTELIDFAPIGITDNTIIFKLKNAKQSADATPVIGKVGAIGKYVGPLVKNYENLLTSPNVASIKRIAEYYSSAKFLQGSVVDSPVSDEIYLPTSGIFAEAILGRSNASEKIDITRFYNWQDSPIPHLAPEIAPADPNTDLSKTPLNTTGNIPGSVLNIINPPSVPDPTGLAASLQAIQNGNMFRDMSKSETLLGVLTNLTNFSTELAKQASTMAGDAQKSTLNSATEIAKAAVSALNGTGVGSGSGSTTGLGSGAGNETGTGNTNGVNENTTTTTPAKVAGTATEKGAALNVLELAEKNGSMSKEDSAKSKALTAGATLTESIGGGGVNPRNPVSVIPTLFGNVGSGGGYYSISLIAVAKKKIDDSMKSKGIDINISDEKYLKALIKEIGHDEVKPNGSVNQLQFYIIIGGGEGFLASEFESVDAGKAKYIGRNWDEAYFDWHDLLVVFNGAGNLIDASLLTRPILLKSSTKPKYNLSEATANKVYNSWDNKTVMIIYNSTYDYIGLGVKDGFRGKTTIDIHSFGIGTHGCILLNSEDQKSPFPAGGGGVPASPNSNPRLINNIITSLGLSSVTNNIDIGTMKMISVK